MFVVGFVFLIPACNQGYEQGNDAQQQQCPGNKVAFIAIRNLAEFFDAHNWLITALFAGLVTLFTWRLWQATIELRVATDKLWDAGERQRQLAEDTAERQLRAYVFVDGGSLILMTTDQGRMFIQGRVVLKNFGQTPGYKFATWTRMDVLETKSPVFRDDLEGFGESVIGPGSKRHVPVVRGPIDTADLQAIRRGTKSIFIWGRIDYVDAFGKARYLKFYNVSGREISEPGAGPSGKWAIEQADKPYEAN